ncbi:endo-1,4-beta-xylanase [Marinilabilia salmonicolor]|uniref:endo-1,4-beta-xylanase n=1 Tax=Marinilabilia salmonicolor TaxID=989 RepID=UPI0002F39CE9|nr:endo-1,4-beta-xylanase [Marinilabilia salmonicolor]
MRHKINVLGMNIMLLALVSSCVDDSRLEFDVAKPESIQQGEYLNDYDALKTYVDRSAHPDFKLGAGVTVSEYNKQGLVYRVMNSNFDELTAGNAMKYNSVVKEDGSMDFSQVVQFVSAARNAETEIYGHTLVWHAQQNKEYLEDIIADQELDVDPNATVEVVDGMKDYSTDPFTGWVGGPVQPVVENGVLVVTNTEAQPNFYDVQYHVADGIPTIVGARHQVTIRIKGSTPGEITMALGTWGNTADTKIPISEEWNEVTAEFNGLVENSFVMLQSGNYVGTYEIEWVKVAHQEAPAVKVPRYIYESDFSDGEPIGGWGNGSTREVINEELVMTNPSVTDFWAAQAAIDFPEPLIEGETYFLNLKIKGSTDGQVRPGFQNPSDYSSGGDFSPVSFTTEWKEVTVQTTVTSDAASRFLFSYGDFAGTIYIDDLKLYYEESMNKIPLTDEEKADTLTFALDNWIAGMMEATDGYVTAWDVVNEPISGVDNDGDGFYDLQSAENGDPENNFYWQDYLGDNFVRVAVELAREHGPENLKLFINDYNLESDWDDNQKLKSLIHWIEQWELDGVTVIDGIGTQMHVSYHLNPETQSSKEEHIVKMLELLAATGKLIKITELDMGIVDESGEALSTGKVTIEQYKAMATFYNFIIQKYFEIIPASQQYGIAHWSPTDSPDVENTWRRNEPIGLWTLNFDYRKHTYAGFADGLAGEDFVDSE